MYYGYCSFKEINNMYPEFEKINAYLARAKRLLDTKCTMEDIFMFTTDENSKEIAIEYKNDDFKLKKIKYKQLKGDIINFAKVISKKLADVEKNQPVVLKAKNSPYWIMAFYAILMAGFKPVLIAANTAQEATANLIKQAKAVAIVTDDLFNYEAKKVTIFDLRNGNYEVSFKPNWENEVFFCSSGTTGDVKLMVYNGENLCHQICESLDMGKETKDIMYPKKYGKIRILAMVPFHHIFGFVAVFLWYTFYGKTLVFPTDNTPTELQETCIKRHVTHVYSVPLFWDSLALSLMRKAEMGGKKELVQKIIDFNLGKISKEEAGKASWKVAKETVQKNVLGKDVRYAISGGGYLSKETLETINGIGYNLYNGYGMTEVGVTSVELSSDLNVRLKASIGKPLYGVEYKVGKDNELLIKSRAVHIREIIAGKEQPASLDKDGYFHTGDIVEVDEFGGYHIKGRSKDVIISSDGENIFPDELEIFFKDLKHVNQICVLGIKNGHKEDVALVLEVDNSMNDEDLAVLRKEVERIGSNLPHGVKISATYLARGKLPLANNMKVKRFVIKKDIENGSKDYMPISAERKVKNFDGFDKKDVEETLKIVRDTFSKVLILPTFKIEDSAHWINDLGGDSMSYVELVKELQEKLQITFKEETLGQMTCVNDFVIEILTLKKEKNK